MDLHPSKENSLLDWINRLHLCEPVERIAKLQDGCLLLKLVYKLKGEELSHAPVHLSPRERLSIVSDFAYSVCQAEQCAPLSWDSAHLGNKLELELAKVVLLLLHYGFCNRGMVSSVEFKTELQMAAMFRNVQDGINSLSLSDGLEKTLTTSSLMNHPSGSSVSSLSDDCSPVFTRSASSPLVPFLELNTVASSSFVGSPIQEIMNTPQVQLKRLRKELAREGDVRDELERELAECTTTLLEKEGQISQLQHRIQRLQRVQDELVKDHKTTLMELQEKNEGLLTRVHEVLKKCRDLKTDNSQKEKIIDQLTEENGTLAAQVRSAFAQLTSAEEEITKVTEAHEMSRAEWENRRDSLQKELGQALTDRECLGEQFQILQGKISVLEDELSKVSIQLQEEGEVLGPIVEREKLRQDLADLTSKHSQLEESISCLEGEKQDIETLLSEERRSFEKETLRMEGLISDLQQAVSSIRAEREAQEKASWENQQILSARILCLENYLARLPQLEVQLTAEVAISVELCRKEREKLEAQIIGNRKSLDEFLAQMKSLKQELNGQRDITLEKEKAASILVVEHKALEENFAQLQNELVQATILAKERQSDLIALQKEVEQQETLRTQAQESEEVQRKKLERELTELQSQIHDLTNLASEKEALLYSLNEKLQEQELHQKLLQQSKEVLHKELEELKGKLHSATHQVMAKSDVLKSTQEKMKQMELLCQQKENLVIKAGQAKEILERAVTELHMNQKQEQDKYHQKLDTLKKKKDHMVYVSQSLQKECKSLREESQIQQESLRDFQQELETVTKENEKLSSLHQSLQREYGVSQKIGAELEIKLQEHVELIRALREAAKESEKVGGMATSMFCVGGENEPDHVADDWMRIAELQSRNKACLPHLKSSYPLESRPSLGYSCLPITDEDVRTGDPDDTICRASMISRQLMDSLSSHRLSLALPAGPRDPAHISAGTAAHQASQTARGGARTRNVRSECSPLALKRPAGQLQDSDTPEAKKLASCFPRPATTKGRNLRSTTNNPASSCNRRQSMAFVIDNTPKKYSRGNSRLQRGINKVRSSARKSPNAASLARSATGAMNTRSPLVVCPQVKSPHIASMKSPKISNSAKKKTSPRR